MRALVITNPRAGRGRRASTLRQLGVLLQRESDALPGSSFTIVETEYAGHAGVLASSAANQGYDVVAAAGGDGTLNDVINGIGDSGLQIAIIPLGTGNDFARHVGVGNSIEVGIKALFQGVPKLVDVGMARGRRFINIAGCGFDAVVAARVNLGYRFMKGTAVYIAAVMQTLATFKPVNMRLTIDGDDWSTRALLCSVANASSYGGGMRVAPDARIDDGQFDVCVIGDVGPFEFVAAFPSVFKGTHKNHPKVTMLRARHIVVDADPPIPVLIDGEVSGLTPATFTIQSRAVTILTPKSNDSNMAH